MIGKNTFILIFACLLSSFQKFIGNSYFDLHMLQLKGN